MKVTSGRPTVLVVDDEAAIRNAVPRMLSDEYEVLEVASGSEAVAAVKDRRIDLVLLDVGLPDVNGINLLPALLEVDRDLTVVMLTGDRDITDAVQCMAAGAADYVLKPFDLQRLRDAARLALRKRAVALGTRDLEGWMKEEVLKLNWELQRERERSHEATVAALDALVTALEAKDAYVVGHSTRVADLAATVAAQFDLPDDEVDRIRTAARLHDLGNIGVRENVLEQQGPLTPDQYEHVKDHVRIGVEILRPLAGRLGTVVDFIRHHHEHWDGTGYPDGLAGTDIPLGARILAAAEVYDAISTPRPYQEHMEPADAIRRIAELSGTVLDPDVVTALNRVVGRRSTLSFLRVEDDEGEKEPEQAT